MYVILIRLTPFTLTVDLWLIQLLVIIRAAGIKFIVLVFCTRLCRNQCIYVYRSGDVQFISADSPGIGEAVKPCSDLLT